MKAIRSRIKRLQEDTNAGFVGNMIRQLITYSVNITSWHERSVSNDYNIIELVRKSILKYTVTKPITVSSTFGYGVCA